MWARRDGSGAFRKWTQVATLRHFPPLAEREQTADQQFHSRERAAIVGVKKTGRGRRKLGRKKRRMRSRIRHRKK